MLRADVTQFQRAAAVMKSADKILQKQVTSAIRKVAKPIGQDVMVTGASGLPKRGGLAFRAAGGRVNVNITSMRAGITLTGHAYKSMDAGIVRHPVFGRRKSKWIKQSIRSGLFRTPFEASAEKGRQAVLAAMTATLEEIKAKS